jgi:Cu/Ag efflux protein CusF
MTGMLARYACATGFLLALTIGANATGAAAQGDRPGDAEKNAPLRVAQAQQSEPGKTYRGVGFVTAIEPATGSLTINHQPIEGLMPAMEMMFRVRPRALSDGIRPGDEIEFSVEGKTFTILEVKIVGHTE